MPRRWIGPADQVVVPPRLGGRELHERRPRGLLRLGLLFARAVYVGRILELILAICRIFVSLSIWRRDLR